MELDALARTEPEEQAAQLPAAGNFADVRNRVRRRASQERPQGVLEFTDVTPHILRHTAVTWAMQSGADQYEASDFFGMTVEVLERVYGHHRPNQHKGVGDALTGRNRTRPPGKPTR